MSAIESSDGDGVPTIRLTDDGLETPEYLVGTTGSVRVEKPDIEVTFTFRGDGVPEYSELTVFPTTDPQIVDGVPEGHIKINGRVYNLIDDRDLDECPECGSDKVDATADPPKCYGCDTELEGM